MPLTVIYRASPGRGKNRPPGFSKSVCLASFLRSVDSLPARCRVEFLVDGDLPASVLQVMHDWGHVTALGGVGNSSSYLAGLARALDGDPADSVYLCEDDYLHLPGALATFSAACRSAPAGTYLTLYDHPDRYRRTDDARVPGSPVTVLGGHHWRTVESSAMTFGAIRETMQHDRMLLVAAARFTSVPHDRTMWRTIQGLGLRRPLRWMRAGDRRLLGPVPSLATHVEEGMLAPIVAWDEVASESSSYFQQLQVGSDQAAW